MTSECFDEILVPGTVISERYVIEDKIGEGGMGIVYRARQISLDRPVALKVILSRYSTKKGARERFAREARVTSALKHPNAIEVYDFGDYQDTLYLAMELLEGVSLRSFVDEYKPPLSVRRSAQIAASVADVLIASFAIGLVHRDLKPENIFLDYRSGEERIVVLDFGLAFMHEEGSRGRITQDGLITGTPDYMSPEQARGVEVTPASDIYSLGCLLYEMLTSTPPFSGEPSIIVAKHLFGNCTPLRQQRTDVEISASLEELVHRMLSKSPVDRPNARSVRDALRKIAEHHPERTSDSEEESERFGRHARMVSDVPQATKPPPAMSAPLSDKHAIGWVSDEKIPMETAIALDMAGFQSLKVDANADLSQLDVAVLFVPNPTAELLQQLSATGVPIIAQTDKEDIENLTRLLRMGASDVVISPYAVDELVRKLARTVRKAR